MSVHTVTTPATGTQTASRIAQESFHGEWQLYVPVAMLGTSRTNLSPLRRASILFAQCKVPHTSRAPVSFTAISTHTSSTLPQHVRELF